MKPGGASIPWKKLILAKRIEILIIAGLFYYLWAKFCPKNGMFLNNIFKWFHHINLVQASTSLSQPATKVEKNARATRPGNLKGSAQFPERIFSSLLGLETLGQTVEAILSDGLSPFMTMVSAVRLNGEMEENKTEVLRNATRPTLLLESTFLHEVPPTY